ncbi:MAG: EamA family transporter [Deltaproteobacteria bacterium]|nr:EamA family transporter [Candidatus Zymogenaceae bacterium]
MLWLPITLLSAVSFAAMDTVCKGISHRTGVMLLTGARIWGTLPFLVLLIPFVEIPSLSWEFVTIVAVLIPLDVFALVLYIWAIRSSPLSATLPFLALTPLFNILTGFILLGETVSLVGVLGIVLVTGGAYAINLHTIGKGLFEPIRSIGRERGSVIMIFLAALFSVTSVLAKKGILLSSPLFFTVTYFMILSLALIPVVLVMGPGARETGRRIINDWKWLSLIGLFALISYIAHFIAVIQVEVAYMIAVKRTMPLFGIVFGKIFFDEPYFRQRMAAGALMVAGVLVIAFA